MDWQIRITLNFLSRFTNEKRMICDFKMGRFIKSTDKTHMGCYGIYYFQLNVKTTEFVVLDNMNNNRFIVFLWEYEYMISGKSKQKTFLKGDMQTTG